MLEAIVQIFTHLYFKDKCCKDFVPSPRMLALFDSNNNTLIRTSKIKIYISIWQQGGLVYTVGVK